MSQEKGFGIVSAYSPSGKMECRKRLAWTIACERAVVTKEDAFHLYEKMMKEFEAIDKRNEYKEKESNKTQ
jgi:hypothetical protein